MTIDIRRGCLYSGIPIVSEGTTGDAYCTTRRKPHPPWVPRHSLHYDTRWYAFIIVALSTGVRWIRRCAWKQHRNEKVNKPNTPAGGCHLPSRLTPQSSALVVGSWPNHGTCRVPLLHISKLNQCPLPYLKFGVLVGASARSYYFMWLWWQLATLAKVQVHHTVYGAAHVRSSILVNSKSPKNWTYLL